MLTDGGRALTLVDVAAAADVPAGTMVHVAAAGRELLLANVNGEFHAVRDRCSHEGALLSGGRLDGTVVTCPAHGSRFDVTTGKNLSGPVMADLPGLEQLSPRARALAREKAAEMAAARVGDLRAYRVTVENGRVLVDV
jgi:nitrite reductase/ring-hydroxylating ferredoxin subunit